jgi:hypothetical protein
VVAFQLLCGFTPFENRHFKHRLPKEEVAELIYNSEIEWRNFHLSKDEVDALEQEARAQREREADSNGNWDRERDRKPRAGTHDALLRILGPAREEGGDSTGLGTGTGSAAISITGAAARSGTGLEGGPSSLGHREIIISNTCRNFIESMLHKQRQSRLGYHGVGPRIDVLMPSLAASEGADWNAVERSSFNHGNNPNANNLGNRTSSVSRQSQATASSRSDIGSSASLGIFNHAFFEEVDVQTLYRRGAEGPLAVYLQSDGTPYVNYNFNRYSADGKDDRALPAFWTESAV